MNRSLLIKCHIALAGFFLAFFLFIPLSGTLYLLGIKGSVSATEVFTTDAPFSNSREFFIGELKKNGIDDFDYEAVKQKGDTYILRPATRLHYQAVVSKDIGGNTLTKFVRLEPNLTKKLMEAHMGHGPKLFKRLQTLFGIAFLCTVLGGVVLAATVTGYLKVFAAASGAGVLVVLLALLL